MNEELIKKIMVLLLDRTSTKLDIATLLMQYGEDISDEDLCTISSNSSEGIEDDGEIREEIPYELSEDKTSLLLGEVEKDIPQPIKETFIKIPTKKEARFLADLYYSIQGKRISIANQLRSIKQGADSVSESEENNTTNDQFMKWYLDQMKIMENNVKKALEAFSDSYYISRWAKANMGIGPVIATVLAANLDIKDDNVHASNWWSYCGLNDNNRPWLGKEKSKAIVERLVKENNGVIDDETVRRIGVETQWKYSYLESKGKDKKGRWDKDEIIKACSKVPYNKDLKVLCYKIGHSFRMCRNKPDSLYGRLLNEREDYENEKNIKGEYASQAAEILEKKHFKKTSIAYKYYIKGELPPGHISQRVERNITKLFIGHCYEAMYYNKYGKKCGFPYIIEKDGNAHTDYIGPEVPYESIPRDEA